MFFAAAVDAETSRRVGSKLTGETRLLDALFLRCIVRFIVFPNHMRRPREVCCFCGRERPACALHCRLLCSARYSSFWLLRCSPCAFLDALFLRFIVRFIVFPNHTRRPRYNMKFKGQGDPQAPATPATASPPYAAPMSAPSESN